MNEFVYTRRLRMKDKGRSKEKQRYWNLHRKLYNQFYEQLHWKLVSQLELRWHSQLSWRLERQLTENFFLKKTQEPS